MEYTVSEKLKIIMDRRGVTFKMLAEMTGQSRQNISLKFRKGNFTVHDLEEISAALDVDCIIEFQEKTEKV